MFSFSRIAIVSTIAFSALTSALPLAAPVGDLAVRDFAAVVVTSVPAAGSTLGSRGTLPASVPMILSTATDCVKRAAAGSKSSTEAFSKMHDCMNVATANVNGLRGQSKEVMLAPADGSDATLSNADLDTGLTEIVDAILSIVEDFFPTLTGDPSGDTVMSLSDATAGLLAAIVTLLPAVGIFTGPLLSALAAVVGAILNGL